MRLILVILFSLTMLFSKDISEKLIVIGDNNSTAIQMHLLKLKMVFMENSQTRVLQEKYKLNLEIETLGDYEMVVIKPIRSLAVKNELMLLLTPLFPDIFPIEDNKKEKTVSDSGEDTIKVFTQSSTESNAMHQAEGLIEEVGLQWIALLLLSIIGLTLSLSSRRKMTSLENIQKDLSQKQEQIEEAIKNLGVSGV